MSSSDEKKLISEVTNQIMSDKFATELGQKAIVEREVLPNSPELHSLREVLAVMGQDAQDIGLVPKGLEYKGSLSIHVFASEALRVAAFAPISNPYKLDVNLADAALKNLRDSVMSDYGRRIQKKRSGF